ncbi:MAG: LPXTG cell wall anchor domain-containing protein [Tissierellia bacterium]|nr:LPXTG cell wall anchor domain-containing protein [Tissierellia bacterium]
MPDSKKANEDKNDNDNLKKYQNYKNSKPNYNKYIKNDKFLPKTGVQNNSLINLLGGILIALGSMFSFKKKNKK